MEPRKLIFGGGVSHTIFNPVVFVAVLIAGVLICIWPRNKAIAVFLTMAILIPMDQVLLIGPMHFPVLRILALFGFIRIIREKLTLKTAVFSGGMNGIDKALILLTLLTVVDGVLLWQKSAEFIFQMGNLFTAFGAYFLLRFFVRDEEDVERAIRVFAYIAAVVAVLMLYEQATGTNPVYGLLGGARATLYATDVVRDHRIRAAASFGHPILAGTFGAVLLPLFVGLWLKDRKNRAIAIMGILASTIIPIAANSSTSLLGFLGGVGALCLWPVRKMMRLMRWGVVFVILMLNMVMKSPVWHLIDDAGVVGGSSSYHRYELVNQCILHFSSWFFVGTKNYASWGFDMWDLSNQYVAVAETAGLIPLILFLTIIVMAFKYLGKARNGIEDRKRELFLWAIGSALFANSVAFFGISYFDQTIVAWYALLAIVAAASTACFRTCKDTAIQTNFVPEPVAAFAAGMLRRSTDFNSFEHHRSARPSSSSLD
ncbi:MAG: O-antigen ligase family protein [Candidatus Acidiferrales bacterium]